MNQYARNQRDVKQNPATVGKGTRTHQLTPSTGLRAPPCFDVKAWWGIENELSTYFGALLVPLGAHAQKTSQEVEGDLQFNVDLRKSSHSAEDVSD